MQTITIKANEIKRGDQLREYGVTVTRVTNPDRAGNVRVAYGAGHFLLNPAAKVEVIRA